MKRREQYSIDMAIDAIRCRDLQRDRGTRVEVRQRDGSLKVAEILFWGDESATVRYPGEASTHVVPKHRLVLSREDY